MPIKPVFLSTLAPALLSALFLFAGCAPGYYAPNAQNVPLLTKAGAATTSVSINRDLNRADMHVAMAVARHAGIQANGALWFPPHADASSTDGGSGALFELGAGYFTPLPVPSALPLSNLMLETYLLAAYGAVENHFPEDADDSPDQEGSLRSDVARVALQPALGYKHRYFEAAVSARFATLIYFMMDGDLIDEEISEEESQRRYLRRNRLQYTLEPAITVRGGLPFLRVEAQVGRAFNLSDGDFPQDDNWASLGLVYIFNPP
jgi:hypothetical protein